MQVLPIETSEKEVSFRGRTGVLGVPPIFLNSPKIGG
jgi:hypothetical protein